MPDTTGQEYSLWGIPLPPSGDVDVSGQEFSLWAKPILYMVEAGDVEETITNSATATITILEKIAESISNSALATHSTAEEGFSGETNVLLHSAVATITLADVIVSGSETFVNQGTNTPSIVEEVDADLTETLTNQGTNTPTLGDVWDQLTNIGVGTQTILDEIDNAVPEEETLDATSGADSTGVGGFNVSGMNIPSILESSIFEVIDVVPPSLIAIYISGNIITLVYSENLDETSIPDFSSFIITIDGIPTTITDIEIDLNQVIITVADTMTNLDEVLLTYGVPDTDPIQDTSGNDAPDIINPPVPIFSDPPDPEDNPGTQGPSYGRRGISLSGIVVRTWKWNETIPDGSSPGPLPNQGPDPGIPGDPLPPDGEGSGDPVDPGGNTGGGGDPTEFGPGAAASWRPFADDSPFNKPVPANPTIASNSAAIVAKVTSSGWNSSKPADIPLGASSETVPPFNSDFDHPIYFSQPTDPLYTIQPTGDAYSGWDELYGVQIRIPDNARGANGSDAHLTVVDVVGGTVYDFYHFQYTDPVREVPSGGGTITAKAGSVEALNGDGVIAASLQATDAAWFSLLAGIIRPEELIAGEINHALSMLVKSTNGTFVAPARGLAGSSDPTNAPPCGARFYLAMTFAEIDALTAPTYRKTIWKAMSKYGMYVRDTGSSSWYPSLASANPYITAGQGDIWRDFAIDEGLVYSSGSDYYLLELANGTVGVNYPNYATKLKVLDWTDPNNR